MTLAERHTPYHSVLAGMDCTCRDAAGDETSDQAASFTQQCCTTAVTGCNSPFLSVVAVDNQKYQSIVSVFPLLLETDDNKVLIIILRSIVRGFGAS